METCGWVDFHEMVGFEKNSRLLVPDEDHSTIEDDHRREAYEWLTSLK